MYLIKCWGKNGRLSGWFGCMVSLLHGLHCLHGYMVHGWLYGAYEVPWLSFSPLSFPQLIPFSPSFFFFLFLYLRWFTRSHNYYLRLLGVRGVGT